MRETIPFSIPITHVTTLCAVWSLICKQISLDFCNPSCTLMLYALWYEKTTSRCVFFQRIHNTMAFVSRLRYVVNYLYEKVHEK